MQLKHQNMWKSPFQWNFIEYGMNVTSLIISTMVRFEFRCEICEVPLFNRSESKWPNIKRQKTDENYWTIKGEKIKQGQYTVTLMKLDLELIVKITVNLNL